MLTNINYNTIFVSALMGGISAGCGVPEPKTEKVPEDMNIIVVLTDDLGYGDLGVTGNPIINTPNIDQFASEGVLLSDFHSPSTVSSPSRAALLTGRNPYRSGFYAIQGPGTYLKEDEVTIPEILNEAGYESCFVGKWHLSELDTTIRNEPGPSEQGFDHWMGTTHNAFDGPENTEKFIRNNEPVGEVDGWYCDVIVDEATTWLTEKRDSSKPFFLLVSTHEPHTPIDPPKKYSEMYDNPTVDSLEKTIEYGGINRPADRDISDNKYKYYGTVTQLDDAFGRLLKTIEEQGLDENTLIIFTSDNGPETPVTYEKSLGQWEDPMRDYCFGTPGKFRGMKRHVYEGGHRVPGIARLPGVIPEGTRSDKLFNQSDLLPTITNLLDLPLPEGVNIDGQANFNAFLNKEIKRDRPEIWFYPLWGIYHRRMPQMSMRVEEYTLIGWLPEKPDTQDLDTWFFNNVPERFELYNIIDDPRQRYNLANKKPEKVDSLAVIMEQLFVEMRDEGLK